MKPFSIFFSLLLLPISAIAGGPQQMFFGIDVDPGTRGETFASRTIAFSALDGASADGVGFELDFNFTVDEQLSFTDTGSDGFDLVLRVDYSATPPVVTDLPDASIRMSPIFETSGVPTGSGVVIDGNTAVFTVHFEDEEGVLFNSIRYNVIDPFIDGGTVTGASLEFKASGPGGSFEVTTPQPPGAVLVDGFTGVVSGDFPVVDDNTFNPNGASERPFTPTVAYQRDTSIFLETGTSITAIADTSGTGSMDFVVAPGSTGTFYLSYGMGRHDITHGGLNDQLVIETTGLTSLEVRLNDIYESIGTTVPVVGNKAIIPLQLSSFDGPPPAFDFSRVTNIRVETPSAVGAGTYTIEQIAVTSSAGPQVLSIAPDSPGPVISKAGMNYTVLFSESVTGFDNIFDLETVTTNITGSLQPFGLQTSDNTTYTFTLRPTVEGGQSSGTVVVSIDPTGGIIDGDSNGLVTPNPSSELVTFEATAYQQWVIDEGLTPGVNDGYSQDPDSDDRINGAEFVRNTSPLSADDPEREFFHITDIEGVEYGTLTVATRADRTYFEIDDGWLQSDFSGGSDGFVVDVADNIRATDDLSFDRFTSPPTVLDPSVEDPPGLPPLDEGWEWYHFRFEQSVDALGRGFMRTEIEDLD